MSEIDRDTLPENLQGTFDDLNDFVFDYVKHMMCIDHHKEEMERLSEEIEPRIALIIEHVDDLKHLGVFGEFMDSLKKPDAEG